MKLKTLVTIFLLVLVLVPVAAMAADPTPEPLKDFTFEGLDGTTLDTSTLRGKPVVIVIAATWCPPCKREADDVEKAYLEYKGKGVVFLGVFALSSESSIKKFVKKHGVTFPVGKADGLREQFGWKSFPKTAFVDSDGVIQVLHGGEINYKQMAEGIEKILH